MCSGGESISFSKLTSISTLSNIVNCGNGQTTRRPMRREPDMRNETNPCADVHICHELSPDDNNTVSSDIYNLSPEVFDFRRRYSSNFLFGHVNINSFRHKYPFIHDMLIKQSVDLLAISESKLDHSFTNSQFQVTDYAIYRQDLTLCSGGLFVYVRADLPHRRLGKSEVNYQGFESLCLEITVGKTKTAFCCIYKHPKVKNDYFKKCVSNVCDSLLQSYDDLVIFGDANCCPEKSNTVKDICDVYGLTNLIKTPTCHKGPVSTLIDIILVSNPKRYIDTLNANSGLSDHHNIIGVATRRFALSLKPRRIYYRSYKHFCEEKYLHDINCAPFHVADIFDDIDDMAWFHSSLIRTMIDENAPMKSKIVKNKCVPYMNSKLRKAQFARNMSRNKFRRFGKSQ